MNLLKPLLKAVPGTVDNLILKTPPENLNNHLEINPFVTQFYLRLHLVFD